MNESQAASRTAGACSACGVLALGPTRRTRVRPVGSRRATNARRREHLLHSNPLLPCGPSLSALSHSAPLLPPSCSTPPCRTPVRPVALRPLVLRPVALGFGRMRHAGLRPVACSDALDSALFHSGSSDSAPLLLRDPSHSDFRASSDSSECVRSAPPCKKLRPLDSILPTSDPNSYAVLTTPERRC